MNITSIICYLVINLIVHGAEYACRALSHSVVSDSCDPVDCSLPGFFVQGILQARIPEWVAISFSKGSSQPRDWTQVSCIADFTDWATREAHCTLHFANAHCTFSLYFRSLLMIYLFLL